MAKRYRANGFSASEDAAFFLLLDLMTFFDLFHSNKIDEALDIVSKIKVCISVAHVEPLTAPTPLAKNFLYVLKILPIFIVFFSTPKSTATHIGVVEGSQG